MRFSSKVPEQHKLFLENEVRDILESKSPKITILEQVPGFNQKSDTDGAQTHMERFVQKLRALGKFHVRVLVLDAREWICGFPGKRTVLYMRTLWSAVALRKGLFLIPDV